MGRKKGGGARTPYEAPNTLNSAQDLRIIDAICEGEIAGFANGDDAPFKSIYFDDTPVQNPDNSFNFKGVTGFFQAGTPDQSYIPNFDATERTVPVSAPVKRNAPIVRAISDNTINRLRVTVGVERNLQVQENGDTVAANTELVIELLNNSGVQAARNVVFNEKGSSAFYHDVIFDTLPAAPFNLRVRRVTADSTSDKIANNTFFASYVEIIDAKLSYPHTALAALKIDSDQFGNSVPRRNYLIKGKIVQIPSNYDPETRQYSGSLWDGSFKAGWTNNPAWVFYDLLVNARYSTLAHRLSANDVDKWALYQIAKYCDELVPDGFGGQEPRFVCNAYITDQRQAGELLSDLASVFCGLPIWNGSQISVLQDKHTDPVAAYSNANVVNGFNYSGVQLKNIHTAVHVQYADKHDGYRAKVEYVPNNQAVERYGLNIKRVTAFGCDSRGQAVRFGNWILETELRQQDTVTFTVGREGLKHLPYDVIQIADNDFAGAQIGGRIVAVSGKQITLDRDIANAVGAMFFYTDTVSGSLKSVKIAKQINKTKIELENQVNARVDDVWAMSGRVKSRLYRAMSVKENSNDGTYTITALRHDPEKYGAVDTSAIFDNAVNTLHDTIPELNNAAVSAENGGLRLAWDNLATDGEVLDYDIKVYQNNVLYRHFPNNPTAEINLDNLPDGDYRAEIRGRNARGVYSPVLIKTWQINYTINGLRANAKTFAIELVWTLPEILAVAANTEIWYGTNNQIQAARKLATLPTPQNSYTLTGVGVTDRFYFWARLVDVNGRAGTFTAPILGQADSNPAPIVAQIQGAITESALSRDLLDQFAANDTAAENRAKADAASKIQAEANARAAAIRAEVQARQAAINQAAQTAQTNLNAKAAELTAQAATLGNRVAAVENVNAQQAQAIQMVTAAQSNTAAALEAEKVARATELQAETAARETLAARLATAESGIVAEREARTTADNAQTQQIQAAQSRLNAAESNIGNLQRTTSEQNRALSEMQTTLTARIDGLSVGGRNLLKNSARRHEGAQYSTRYELTEAPAVGDDVAVTVWGDLGSDRTGIGAYNSHGFGEVVRLQKIADGIYRGVGKWKKPMRGGAEITPNDTHLNVYFYPNSATSINIINKIKLEKGNIGTDWSPAPEDTQTAAEAVQAELTAYKSAQATAEAAQTAEIQAAKAQIGQAQTTLEQMRSTKADKTEVLGLVQTTLQSSWRSDVVAAENRAKAEATRLNSATDAKITALQQTVSSQNSATATRLDTLSASINNINVNVGGRNLLLKSDVGRTTLGTSRYDITPNFDLSTIDELVLSVDIDVANFKRNVTTTYSRIGAEIQVFYDDEPNTQNFVWFRAWFMGSDTAQTSKQRLVAKFKVPDGKRVAKLSYNKVQIHNAVFDHAVVKNIKLEIGNVATAWTPAPEDVQPATEAAIGALQQTIASQNTALASRVDTVTAKMDNLAVGGRNLLLGSDRGLRSRNTGTNMWQPNVSYVRFDVAASVTWHTVRHFTLSCYTEFNNIRGNAGSEFTRLGFEALVHFTDGGSQWISNFIQAPNTQAFSGRPSFTFNTPNGKTIARLEHTQLCLQGLSSGANMVVWRPKIEIGSVATDWTPAPEDMEQKVQAMYSLKVEAVGNRKAVAGLALGADGQTGDSQMLVIADKFALVQPHTQNIQAPFVVATVNGQTKMALAGDFVADGTILGRNIAAHQTLQAPNIHGGSLNIGGGRFTVNHDGHVFIASDPNRVQGLRMNNNHLIIYDENGVEQVRLGLL